MNENDIDVELKPKVSKKIKIFGIVAGVIVAGLVGLLGYYLIAGRPPKNVAIDDQPTSFYQTQTPQVGGFTTDQGVNFGVGTTSPPLTQSPTPSPITQPVPQAANQEFSSTRALFAATVPQDWRIIRNTSSEVVFERTDKARYSVQRYNLPASSTEDIKKGLQNLGNIHNVTNINFAGLDALSFDVDGIYQKGVAIFTNGRLYYLLGPDILNSPLNTFRVM